MGHFNSYVKLPEGNEYVLYININILVISTNYIVILVGGFEMFRRRLNILLPLDHIPSSSNTIFKCQKVCSRGLNN